MYCLGGSDINGTAVKTCLPKLVSKLTPLSEGLRVSSWGWWWYLNCYHAKETGLEWVRWFAEFDRPLALGRANLCSIQRPISWYLEQSVESHQQWESTWHVYGVMLTPEGWNDSHRPPILRSPWWRPQQKVLLVWKRKAYGGWDAIFEQLKSMNVFSITLEVRTGIHNWVEVAGSSFGAFMLVSYCL